MTSRSLPVGLRRAFAAAPGVSTGRENVHMSLPSTASHAGWILVMPLMYGLVVRTISVKTRNSGGDEWNSADEGWMKTGSGTPIARYGIPRVELCAPSPS